MDRLFSEAIILNRGQIIAHEDCDVLRQKGVTVTGKSTEVDSFAAGHEILSERTLGDQKEVVLFGELTDIERNAVHISGLNLSNPPLQDLFIHMTDKGGNNHEA
jgi:ABC-2 type transport system ATP-binding protein